ncbi:uncharacterized protein [Periplaneta americana]|uniref:uncharacterized protein n=1 Tax=Periplaneta americana TaxID=6978 RepID=UPI0037E74174
MLCDHVAPPPVRCTRPVQGGRDEGREGGWIYSAGGGGGPQNRSRSSPKRITMKSLVLIALSLCTLAGSSADAAVVKLRAKLVARAKVSGPGFSALASSVQHCLALCNKRPDDCDAINFHEPSGKCRFLQRCAPISVGAKNPDYYFYSKRPQILSEGFLFEQQSESCLRLVRNQTDFATADMQCAELNGRLATLNTPALNQFAAGLLRAAGVQYAWFGLRDVDGEGNPTHSDGSKASDRGFFLPAPQHWRNDTNRNCWALQDDGKWAEVSCKGRHLFSICEVPPF